MCTFAVLRERELGPEEFLRDFRGENHGRRVRILATGVNTLVRVVPRSRPSDEGIWSKVTALKPGPLIAPIYAPLLPFGRKEVRDMFIKRRNGRRKDAHDGAREESGGTANALYPQSTYRTLRLSSAFLVSPFLSLSFSLPLVHNVSRSLSISLPLSRLWFAARPEPLHLCRSVLIFGGALI